ncbi:MAG: polymer-forming cytoskeletal protein [Deltaproteobacteria bacterium]|nr:polymer-forming cytoskeletal protein [Deltaproteobacteria bacterium]
MWHRRRNSSAPDRAATSVINQGCVFEGRLTFVGVLIVNGKFQGELISSGTVIVGETGVLQADLRVGTVILAGQISGHITASERVELRQTARILGDIATPVLVLEEGVIFDGHCKMKGKEVQVIHLKGEDGQHSEKRADKRALV